MRRVTPNPKKGKDLLTHVEADQSASNSCPPCRAAMLQAPSVPSVPSMSSAASEPATARPVTTTTADQATIGKSFVIKGEVTGSESLYIDEQAWRDPSTFPAIASP